MDKSQNLVRRISDGLNGISAICLLLMTVLTCADVVLRLFRRPILGAYELVQFMAAAVAAFAMAHTTFQRGHVAVEVLVIRLPKKAQKVIYILTHLLSVLLFAILAYECVVYGNDLKRSG
jgi:TRAP-type C4-dicarboxylate transport system permease small subunit